MKFPFERKVLPFRGASRDEFRRLGGRRARRGRCQLALYGFVSLEGNEGFAFPAFGNRGFDRLVCALARVLPGWDDMTEAPA